MRSTKGVDKAADRSKEQCGGRLVPRLAQRRRQVTDAARALFCQHGFHSTGMAQISAAAGVRMGQIYRDFCGKEAIMADIVQDDLDRFLDEATLDRAMAAGDRIAIRTWISDFVRREIEVADRQLLPEILAEASRNRRIAGLLKHADGKIRLVLETALRALAPEPDKADRCADLADVIETLAIGLSQRLLTVPEIDGKRLSSSLSALVESEVDRLIA